MPWGRSESAIHIKALVNIANVYVAQKAYDKAVQYASLAITLGPHLPEGYLRMVMVIRRGGLKCTPDMERRCNWLDMQASHIVRAYGDKNHEMLKPIGRRIRRDIVRGVPAEIRQMILRNLSQADICRAMRVNKVWKVMCRDRQLWKDLRLVKNWRPPRLHAPFRPGTLNNIVKLSGYMATSLTIDGLKDFNVNGAKLRAFLRALPKLEALSLSGIHDFDSIDPRTTDNMTFQDVWTVIWENAPSGLKALHLSSFGIKAVDRHRTLANCRFKDSLKELSLVRLRLTASVSLVKECAMSEFISLDTLTIQDCKHEGPPYVAYLQLHAGLPDYACLSNLTLSGVSIGARNVKPRLDWACLQRLVLGKTHSSGSKIPTSKILRSLELNEDGFKKLNYLMWREIDEEPFLPALEHFRCHYDPYGFSYFNENSNLVHPSEQSLAVQSLLGILRPSIENGTLRYLDLTWSILVKAGLDTLFTAEPEQDRKETIRILSCHGIEMPSIVTGFGGNCDEFLGWVETFPNLTTVGAYPQKSENAHMLILWLMKRRPDIKTIYTDALKGAERDMVLAEAEKRSVTVIHADRVPEPFLEPLVERKK
ncbi:hypothetical protein N0V82_010825 [Gnomoniopsis sp. IMI 355080]|nr:hypothetical protein N0V82_010825 [Gnomoniopsis sp. IMI 355080]